MSRIRRALTVTALALAVSVGLAAPATATFADTVVAKSTITTLTVSAPSSVTVAGGCRPWWYAGTVRWSASTTTRGVTGYRVLAHLHTGQSVVMGETDASTTSLDINVRKGNLFHLPRFSVVTLTSYGWTARSPQMAVATC